MIQDGTNMQLIVKHEGKTSKIIKPVTHHNCEGYVENHLHIGKLCIPNLKANGVKVISFTKA